MWPIFNFFYKALQIWKKIKTPEKLKHWPDLNWFILKEQKRSERNAPISFFCRLSISFLQFYFFRSHLDSDFFSPFGLKHTRDGSSFESNQQWSNYNLFLYIKAYLSNLNLLFFKLNSNKISASKTNLLVSGAHHYI